MVRIIFGYFEGKPKQFTPALRSSTFSIGRTLREGNPGYGILVPGISSGLNDTVDSLLFSETVTRELHLIILGSPMSRLQDGSVSFTAGSYV